MNTCGFFGSSFLAVSTVTMRLRHPDLDGGKADARRLVHRLEHVIDQRAHLRVHGFHRLGFLSQSLVGKNDDVAQRHARRFKRRSASGQPPWRIPASAPLARQFSTTATRLRRSAPVMVVTVAVVMTMVFPVSSAMVPGPVVHLLGARHAVCRRSAPGRHERHRRRELRRRERDRGSCQNRQDQFAHGFPSCCGHQAGRHALNPR